MTLAASHQVRPLLFDYLQHENMIIPDKYAQILRNNTISQAVTNMTFLKISINLYNQLSDSNVPTFLMKGALWAWMLYDKPAAREFGDIDFFIEKHSIKRSLSILALNGFEPDRYRTYLLNKERIAELYLKTDYQLPLTPIAENALQSLEIQWNSSYPRYCYSFTWQELTNEMMDFSMSNATIRVPKIENQLLMMLIHHAGVEQWDKLKYLADFVRLLRKYADKLDWNYVTKTASSKGFNRLLNESLGLIREITGEDYLSYTAVKDANRYPDEHLLSDIIDHWENGRPVLKSKSWRIFAYNVKYRDNLKVRLQIVLAHLSYLTQWQLLWQKFIWYRKFRFK